MLYMLVDAYTGAEVTCGDTVTTFRGEQWTFERITDNPTPGKSGRIEVVDPMGDGRMWYYPQVVDARIVVDLRKLVDVLHNDPSQDGSEQYADRVRLAKSACDWCSTPALYDVWAVDYPHWTEHACQLHRDYYYPKAVTHVI